MGLNAKCISSKPEFSTLAGHLNFKLLHFRKKVWRVNLDQTKTNLWRMNTFRCMQLCSKSLHCIFNLCLLFLLLYSVLREISLLCLKCVRKLFIKFLMFMHYSPALYSKIQLTESAQGKRKQCFVHAVSRVSSFFNTFTFYVVGSGCDVMLSPVVL